ncbi:MAG: hypothetical protein FJY21_02955 [Bacteroidetes bacterium]|nr:hypothetical protein [Bacteroidota bacterium]
MRPISDKELDKLFQHRLGNLEIEPSGAVWKKISVRMDQKRRKKSLFPIFWMAAASITVIIATGLWYFRSPQVIFLHGSTDSAKPILDTAQPEPSILVERPVSPDKTLITNPSDLKLVSSTEVSPEQYTGVQNTAAAEAELPLIEPVVPVAESANRLNQVQVKKTIQVLSRYSDDQSALDANQPDKTAKFDFSDDGINQYEAEVRKQKKIRSIGSLVNFVMSKVDKREDKLIEFKESDEGSEVSGINLGLVKIKSKK